jgi:hypothetical protein
MSWVRFPSPAPAVSPVLPGRFCNLCTPLVQPADDLRNVLLRPAHDCGDDALRQTGDIESGRGRAAQIVEMQVGVGHAVKRPINSGRVLWAGGRNGRELSSMGSLDLIRKKPAAMHMKLATNRAMAPTSTQYPCRRYVTNASMPNNRGNTPLLLERRALCRTISSL